VENVHRSLTDRPEPRTGGAATRLLLLPALVAALCGGGCGSDPERVLSTHRQTLASCEHTAAMIGEAWLTGTVTARYALTASAETVRLLGQRQAELLADLPLLATNDGAAISDAEERVSRAVAALSAAIDLGDATAVRRQLDTLKSSSSPP
jgi:hypothetical protein